MIPSALKNTSKSRLAKRPAQSRLAKKQTPPRQKRDPVFKPKQSRSPKNIVSRRMAREHHQSRWSQIIKSILVLIFSAIILLGFSFYFLLPKLVFSDNIPENVIYLTSRSESGNGIQSESGEGSGSGGERVFLAHLVQEPEQWQLIQVSDLGISPEKLQEKETFSGFNRTVGLVFSRVVEIKVDTADNKPTLASTLEGIWHKPEQSKNYLQFYFLFRQIPSASSPTKIDELVNRANLFKTIDDAVTAHCPVAVTNTTSINALASRVSQIIEQSGAVVVRVKSGDSEFNKSSLYVGEEVEVQCQALITLIKSIFPSELIVVPANKDLTNRYRAQLILFLGEDLEGVF